MGIRELTDCWARQSYEQGCDAVERSGIYEKRIISKLRHYLFELKRFRYKQMDGNSVQDLRRYEPAEQYEQIRFADIVNRLKNDDGFSPVKYMAQITKLCDERGLTESMTIGLLARGLRSFPSFLREMDVEEQLENILTERRIPYSIARSTEMDVAQHTDILVSSYGRDYRIWLFQNSKRGIRNTMMRLREERGKLPQGIHVLCPMNPMGANPRCIMKNGWCFYQTSYVKEIVDCIENPEPDRLPPYEKFIQGADLSEDGIQTFVK